MDISKVPDVLTIRVVDLMHMILHARQIGVITGWTDEWAERAGGEPEDVLGEEATKEFFMATLDDFAARLKKRRDGTMYLRKPRNLEVAEVLNLAEAPDASP